MKRSFPMALSMCVVGLLFHTSIIAQIQNGKTPSGLLMVPEKPIITSDLPAPGKTSVTFYQSDYVQPDGTYVPGLHMSFTTSVHCESGVKSIIVDSKIGGSTVNVTEQGKTDMSVTTALTVTGVPPMNTPVAQTVVDQKGVKVSRIFMVHIKARNPRTKLTKAQIKALRFK